MYLRGIGYVSTQAIQREYPSATRRKLALFNEWLRMCPDATWEHVIHALETAGENVIASDIRRDYSTPSSEEPKG